MRLVFNNALFSKHMREKRVVDKKNKISISLRDAEKQSGISPTTLCRIDSGSFPDIETLARACKWMGKPMEEYFKNSK